MRLASPGVALHFLHLFVCWFVCAPTFNMCNNYIMYIDIVAMQLYLVDLTGTGVATMSSLAHL